MALSTALPASSGSPYAEQVAGKIAECVPAQWIKRHRRRKEHQCLVGSRCSPSLLMRTGEAEPTAVEILDTSAIPGIRRQN